MIIVTDRKDCDLCRDDHEVQHELQICVDCAVHHDVPGVYTVAKVD